jgi:CO/xanthine dehydrogenase Mo-binding subunit
MPKRTFEIVNKPLARREGPEKVTGKAQYIGDMKLPNMVYGKILRSPFPSAKVLKIDADKAREVPGVVTVLTRDDFSDIDPYFGPALRDRPILAIDKVRYVGDPVAAVAACDEATAEAALELIDVDYEEIPALHTVDDALKPDAPILHEKLRPAGHFQDLASIRLGEEGNIAHRFRYERGDVEKEFRRADYVFEHTFTTPPVHHCNLEPHVAIAQWEQDELTVWSATQNPFPVRAELANIFKMPLSKVRVIASYLGGGNGGKAYAKIEPLVAALARKAGRPVKIALSMEEAFKTITRHATQYRLKTGVNKEGEITARECVIYWDKGAYGDIGIRLIRKSGYTACGPYRIPNLKIDSCAVYTNKVPAGALRGYGVAQTTWAIEQQTDIIAKELGIDPVEFRLKNLLNKEEEFAPGDPVDCDFKQGLRTLAEAFDWGKGKGKNRGKGVACFLKATIAPSISQAIVRVHPDGSVTLLTTTTEMGQGARTVLCQILAEELSVPFDKISLAEPDTSRTPYDMATVSSRSTVTMGLAVQKAARDAKRQLIEMASKMLAVEEGGLTIRSGCIYKKGTEEGVPYSEVIRDQLLGGEVIGVGTYKGEKNSVVPLGAHTPFWEVAFGGAEVEVDQETGDIKLLRYVTAPDVGKVINPLLCRGQSDGSVLFGIGQTLFEEMIYEDGQLLNPNFVDYAIPRFSDCPRQLETIFIENEDGAGPYGAKGVGEGDLIPVAAAIGNALHDAVGVRLFDLPITPEKILTALKRKGESTGKGG